MTRTILIALLAAVAADPAAAAVPTASIIVSPADLASAKGRAALDRRIATAVENVCGSYAAMEQYQWPEIDACRKSARKQVEAGLAQITGRRTTLEVRAEGRTRASDGSATLAVIPPGN